MNTIDPNLTDIDQFKLMMYQRRTVVKISICVGIPLVGAMAISNFIKGYHFVAFLNCVMLLIAVLLGFAVMGRIDEKFEHKIYSFLFRLFDAAVGIALLYGIRF